MESKPKSAAKSFWTVAGIAEDLDVSERTVHRWIASNKLIAHHFGKLVRIADTDRRAFLAARRGF